MASVPISPLPPGSHAAPQPIQQSHTLDYVGPTGTLFGIFYKNLALTILTLGIYRFWAKTRERRFLWAHTRIGGEGFEYTGSGKELFVGFLKAVAVLVPLFGGLQVLELFVLDENLIGVAILGMIRTILIVGLIYAGSYAARRYRMSRTTWRGIRFQQNGSIWRYAGTALIGILLAVVTLGLYLPFLQARLMRYELANLKFGSASFRFDGTGKELFQHFMKVWIVPVTLLGLVVIDTVISGSRSFVLSLVPMGLVVVIGICVWWYLAKVYRFQAERTALEGLRFSMPRLTGWRLFRLHAGNYLITVFSIGLLMPLATQRTMRFWVDHTDLHGSVVLEEVAQADRGPRSGEGLAGFFDVDVG
jgi:uncharacterized membrane protein YjgN (DUF898 family)